MVENADITPMIIAYAVTFGLLFVLSVAIIIRFCRQKKLPQPPENKGK